MTPTKENAKMYDTVIGLEVHVQLNTASKAFASDENTFTTLPNKNISAITLGLPGTLPKLNSAHVDKAVKLSLALGADINAYNYFDRKNYFYPDLPKGYQITQDNQPISRGGTFTFLSEGQEKTISIHHLHMEEDAGKSSHPQGSELSLIDYNRAGTPLIELVTEPDFRSGQEVHDFLQAFQVLVQYLDISDGNMEEGSIRCDCNVSVKKTGESTLGERCEIKNVNSKKFARQAIEFESNRQIHELQKGNTIVRTTMLFDPETGSTRPMRKKETVNDYRYFPDPDLVPLKISKTYIEQIKTSIDYYPWTLRSALTAKGVSAKYAEIITEVKENGIYFLDCAKGTDIKELADVMVNKLIPACYEHKTSLTKLVTKNNLLSFIKYIKDGVFNKSDGYAALLPKLYFQEDVDLHELATGLNLLVSGDDDFLDELIEKVMIDFPEKVKEYKSGKKGLIGFFMGQVKLLATSSYDPQRLKEKVEARLK